MTAKELAARLDGREYLNEITKEEEAAAKASDLLVIFGRSDDLCELRGAIDDELGCYEGGPLELPALPDTVTAVWCPDELYSWGYETTLPHATFRIHEDGEPYCIGIVIDLALACAEYYWCEECCNFDRDHVGPEGYAKCRFTRLLTFGQTYGKECRGWGRPAENFPEVVRCKDCKHYDPAYKDCAFYDHQDTTPTDFCSHGVTAAGVSTCSPTARTSEGGENERRLIELLYEAEGTVNNDLPTVEQIANYLLGHGVIVPPCKVGQTVFAIAQWHGKHVIREVKVCNYTIFDNEWKIVDPYGDYWSVSNFGKTVFLTREEAEAALAERSEG